MDVVYVIHQFEAENEDEISLCIGDPVVVLERDDGFGDGWWKVRTKRYPKYGWLIKHSSGTKQRWAARFVPGELHLCRPTFK